MASKVLIKIQWNEYDLFRQAIGDDTHLPASYEEWLERGLQEAKEAEANGDVIYSVDVHYKTFVVDGVTTGQKLTYMQLLAHAVAKTVTQK